MLLFSSILGIFLSLILLFFNAKKNSSTVYLSIVFLLISLYAFYQYVLVYSKSVFLINLLLSGFAIVFPPLYLLGPMLYWYIRSVLTDNSRLKRSDFWHLVPMIIFLLAAVPYTFVPLSDKMDAARGVAEDFGIMQAYKATVLSEILSVQAVYLSRPILVLVYTIWSGVLLARYFIKRKVSAVFSMQYFMTKWLGLLLGFLFIVAVSHILLILKVFEMNFSELFFTLSVLRILSGAGLIGLLISPFFFPSILYGLPRVPETTETFGYNAVKPEVASKEERKASYHFESNYLHSIGQKTDSYMMEFHPYLQPGFNLPELSVYIQVPVHHLSYYFREVKKQHFIDYRNEWRINHAKKLIMDGKIQDLTFEAIASLSGFSNRNSFRTTFQKTEGIPPSEFLTQVKE